VLANLGWLDPIRVGYRLFDGSLAQSELYRLVQRGNPALKQVRYLGDRVGIDLAQQVSENRCELLPT
jgi:hypothetical protein